ncbi:DUF4389 domain-containing protein [Cognatishimia sp.]|uniref:DUF4389 domain-containing protein n=1 Tax=Cognatishimia sp. TaxID=2211648 RepID=UPI003516C55B
MTDTSHHTYSDTQKPKSGAWKRGLHMLVFLILFGVAETLLALATVLQFGWYLFAGRRNELIADVGRDLSEWTKDVVAFQTGNTDVKPFPWDKASQRD